MKRLTATAIKHAKPGRHSDGHGLLLYVKESGRKSWVQRLTIHGKRRDIGLGSVELVSLADARAKAYAYWRVARTGGDPLADREKKIPTFREAAEEVVKLYEPTWRTPKTAALWRKTLADYACPVFGDKLVADIDSADVLQVLAPIWTAKPETGRKVKARVSAVLSWCVAQNFRRDNPCDSIAKALPRTPKVVKHFKALHHDEIADALEVVKASGAWVFTKLAIEFAVVTAARSGEVRGATWDEIDLDSAVWTVPGARMKSGREHRVPLSTRAVVILNETRELAGSSRLVFPSQRGKKMSDSGLTKLLRELNVDGTMHGMRSGFRTWAEEHTNAEHAVMEESLAHTVGSQTERAYRRGDLFLKREKLMQRWSDFLGGETAKVVPFSGRA